MEETNKLIPPRIARADAHDAKQAEQLTAMERVRAQAESGNGPVIHLGKKGATLLEVKPGTGRMR